MTTIILAHKQPKTQPPAGHAIPARRPMKPYKTPAFVRDPWRHLIAAYAVQAAIDARWPTKEVTLPERRSALQFLHSEDGQAIIRHLDIPVTKILALVSLIEEEPS